MKFFSGAGPGSASAVDNAYWRGLEFGEALANTGSIQHQQSNTSGNLTGISKAVSVLEVLFRVTAQCKRIPATGEVQVPGEVEKKLT